MCVDQLCLTPQPEVCNNGVDDDFDEMIDMADAEDCCGAGQVVAQVNISVPPQANSIDCLGNDGVPDAAVRVVVFSELEPKFVCAPGDSTVKIKLFCEDVWAFLVVESGGHTAHLQSGNGMSYWEEPAAVLGTYPMTPADYPVDGEGNPIPGVGPVTSHPVSMAGVANYFVSAFGATVLPDFIAPPTPPAE